MNLKSSIQTTVIVVLVVVVLALTLGSFLGQPVLVGYVETESMEPTIESGDGFIAIPTFITSDIEEGDVVTFSPQSISDGEITTHRIEEKTSDGYITRGDGNSVTDQEAGEPTVQDSQITAVVLQIRDNVVTIPSFGSGVQMVQTTIQTVLDSIGLTWITSYEIATITSVIGLTSIFAGLLFGFFNSDKRPTTRSYNRDGFINSKWLLVVLVISLILPVMTSMVVVSDTTTIQIISSQDPSGDTNSHFTVGETKNFDYTVENELLFPRVIILDSESPDIEFSDPVITVSHGETKESTATVTAPDDTGVYNRQQSEHHYYYLLPEPMIVGLHQIHPFVAMSVISGVISTPLIILFLLSVGIRSLSVRSVYD